MEQKLRSGRGALKIRAWGGECSGGEHGECRGPGVGVSWMSLSSKKARIFAFIIWPFIEVADPQ